MRFGPTAMAVLLVCLAAAVINASAQPPAAADAPQPVEVASVLAPVLISEHQDVPISSPQLAHRRSGMIGAALPPLDAQAPFFYTSLAEEQESLPEDEQPLSARLDPEGINTTFKDATDAAKALSAAFEGSASLKMADLRHAIIETGLPAVGAIAKVVELAEAAGEGSTYAQDAVAAQALDYADKLQKMQNKMVAPPSAAADNAVVSSFVEAHNNLVEMLPGVLDFFKDPFSKYSKEESKRRCSENPPNGYTQLLHDVITHDGDCDQQDKCWIKLSDGLPAYVHYSSTELMRWVRVMFQSALFASDLEAFCHLVEGSTVEKTAEYMETVKTTVRETMDNFEKYFEEHVTEMFWKNQVLQDTIKSALQGSTDSTEIAKNMKGQLDALYGNALSWNAVGAWDRKGVNAANPSKCLDPGAFDHSCVTVGGLIGEMPTADSNRNYMIFYTRLEEPKPSAELQEAAHKAQTKCTEYIDGDFTTVEEMREQHFVNDVDGIMQCINWVIKHFTKSDARGVVCTNDVDVQWQGNSDHVVSVAIPPEDAKDKFGTIQHATCLIQLPAPKHA